MCSSAGGQRACVQVSKRNWILDEDEDEDEEESESEKEKETETETESENQSCVTCCISLVSHFVNLFWRCVCAFEFSFIILVAFLI